MNPNIVEAREHDFPQVLKDSFDPQEQRIRVDALVTDGTDALIINPDGSINVNIIDSVTTLNTYRSYFAEATSVPSSTTTLIQTYTVPALTQAFLERIEVAGTNIGMYEVFVNDIIQDRKYTYFGNSLNDIFEFTGSTSSGYPLNAGDTVKVKITHGRPSVGNFNSRIQLLEIP